MAKRIALSLDEEQIKLLRSVIGMGKKDAEIAKNIILAYLSERGYVDRLNKLGSQSKKERGGKAE